MAVPGGRAPYGGYRPEGRNRQKRDWVPGGPAARFGSIQRTAKSGSGASAGLMVTLALTRQR